MNKHSKYRPLMDEMELGIAGGDISTKKLYRHMVNALDDAEATENSLRKELETIKISIPSIIASAVRGLADPKWGFYMEGDLYFDSSDVSNYANSLESEDYDHE